ncbi:MAG: response regulator, partial [Coprothermobacterota bacterium]|nr:response regulator [Coprothermobacterota bacterium]
MTTILVADDDASIRQTLALFLEGKGYRVLVAEDGEEAVALARAEEPDLILLDIRMPRLDGLAALRALKEDVRAPVIMITALDDMESTIRSLQLGAYEFLTKPLDITKLEITLRRALEAKATRQRAQWGARREQEQRQVQLARLVGHSPAMIEIFKRIGLASTSRA